MKQLTQIETKLVSGAQITPGNPTEDICCLNVKLMVIAGREEPGFDMGTATYALVKHCDFADYSAALTYVQNKNTDFADFKEVFQNMLALLLN